MNGQLTPIKRITALYVLFFAVIIASIALMFTSAAFKSGFETGMRDAVRMKSGDKAGDRVNIVYELAAIPGDFEFSIPVYADTAGGVTINARPSTMDVKVESIADAPVKGLGIPTLFTALSSLMYLAIFVIIFIILTSLRRSVKQGSLMSREVIPLTRWIGILLICASLFWSLGGYLESRALASYFEGSGFMLHSSFPFDTIQIITGILVFVIAEIFSIGYRLSEEQKLTI